MTNVSYALDQDGTRYADVQEFDTVYGRARVIPKAWRKDPDTPDQTHWFWGFYAVTPVDSPDASPVALEWHRDRQAFYVGAVGYQRMRDAAGAALAVGRARKGQTA
jgi:hypothetical protein